MHNLSVPLIVMASVNFYVGMYYFFLYIKRPQVKEHLPFSFLCICAGLYDVFSVGLYNSLSVDQGVIWQRLQINTIGFISVFFVWFINLLTEQKSNRFVKIVAACYALIFIVSALVSPELSVTSSRPAIKHAGFFDIYIKLLIMNVK